MFLKRRKERIKREFEEVFGKPFPRTEEERLAIKPHILNILVEVGKEAEAARIECERMYTALSNPELPQTLTKVAFFWGYFAAIVSDQKRIQYVCLCKLARQAGFSKKLLQEVDRQVKKLGAEGGLLLSEEEVFFLGIK